MGMIVGQNLKAVASEWGKKDDLRLDIWCPTEHRQEDSGEGDPTTMTRGKETTFIPPSA